MKNVLLIGDSIRMGYDRAVKETLKDVANIYFPDGNCRCASNVLRFLHEYKNALGDKHVDVLHWNAGLWDCLRLFDEDPQTPIEFYEYYIERICIRIKKLFPSTQVIFATSTSVQSELMQPPFERYNKEIEAYNAAAVAIVTKYGFQVNDLYKTSILLPSDAHSDAVHYYTPMATEVFTNQVVKHLLCALNIDRKLEYKESLYIDKPIGY